jgi:septal ring factor EnvC (AmiA/AmiB activator)
MTKSLQTENAKLKHENRLSNTKFETLVAELAKLEVSLQNANALTAKFRDQITTLEAQNRELRDNLQGLLQLEQLMLQL